MSDSHLPDDVSQWPSDPFALLGVSRSDDERALRAAYVRLIRHFKPEQNSEAFRRIRDAYEFLRERVGYWQYFDGVEDAPEDDAPASPTADDAEAPAEQVPTPMVRVEPGDEAWQAAEAGDVAGAYARLVALETEQPRDETTCVRLYWLLRLAPEIAPQEDRCAWLRRAFHDNGNTWNSMHLYGCELEADAKLAQRATLDHLFGPNVALENMLALLGARWRGLLLAQNWQPIASDVESLRGRFETERVVWLRLLLAAVGQMAWIAHGEARQLTAKWNEEIDQRGDEHGDLTYALDRRDYLMVLVAQIAVLFQQELLPLELAARLRPVLGQLWNGGGSEARRGLMGVLAQALVDPGEALSLWTRLMLVSGAPLVVDYLSEQTMSLYFDWFDGIDEARMETLTESFRRWLAHCQWADYSHCRFDLLAFCLSEHIALAELALLLPKVLPPAELSGSGIEGRLAADRALQLLTAGMRIVEST